MDKSQERDKQIPRPSISVSYDSSSSKSTVSRLRFGGNFVTDDEKKALKEREENPHRQFYFRPKIHQSWKDEDIDDEIADQERLLKEIAKREHHMKKKQEEGGEHDDDDDQDSLEARQGALERLKHRRQREQVYKERLEAETLREDKEKAQAWEEKLLSELQNPSKYGWFYTNGYYENASFFGVKDAFAERMIEEQEVWRDKWISNHPETFTEKFKRFFWPPKLRFKNKMFRTRGTYMDFPEVIADWPKPLEINFEKEEHVLMGNEDPIFQEEPEVAEVVELAEVKNNVDSEFSVEPYPNRPSMQNFGRSNQVIEYNWDDWYYDDVLGQFFRKKQGFMVDYYMDNKNGCWRHKRPQNQGRQPTPYDWYFNTHTGTIIAREDYKGLDEFVYDNYNAIYTLQSIVPTASKNKGRNQPKKSTGGTEYNVREQMKFYYFDEEAGTWLLKRAASEEKRAQILWDENGHRFARKAEGDWRGLTGLSPDDYFFDDKKGRFNPKPHRQGNNYKYHGTDGVWRKTSAPAPNPVVRTTGKTPSDYYFDEFEGQFKLKEPGSSGKYWLQKCARIWRKNPAPRSGKYPEQFYWDRNKKNWLLRNARMDHIRNAQSVRNQWASEITGGVRNSEMTQSEAFFWDVEEGIFILKEPNGSYYLDTDGFWKSTNLRDKQRNRIHPYDFYYDHKAMTFLRKVAGGSYVFKAGPNVWTTTNGPNFLNSDFYFDVEKEKWVSKIDSEVELVDIGFLVKPHPNGKNRVPGHFWFNDAVGRFYPKTLEDTKEYFYYRTDGVWKKKGISGPNPNGLEPKNFYFDDHDNGFKLKIDGQKKDYWYDNNNKIFRHVTASGKTRSGHMPTDFYWNSDLKAYILMKSRPNLLRRMVNQLPKWDPLRRYEKGWLPSEDRSRTNSVASLKSIGSARSIRSGRERSVSSVGTGRGIGYSGSKSSVSSFNSIPQNSKKKSGTWKNSKK